MSLSNAQKGLLKRAQAQAGIGDGEYRDWLRSVAGVESSRAAGLGDRHLDKLLGCFEAIYWRGVDAGALPGPCKGSEPFRKRGFWAQRNSAVSTSRERFAASELAEAVYGLEAAVARGRGAAYVEGIWARVCGGRRDERALRAYRGALERALEGAHA